MKQCHACPGRARQIRQSLSVLNPVIIDRGALARQDAFQFPVGKTYFLLAWLPKR